MLYCLFLNYQWNWLKCQATFIYIALYSIIQYVTCKSSVWYAGICLTVLKEHRDWCRNTSKRYTNTDWFIVKWCDDTALCSYGMLLCIGCVSRMKIARLDNIFLTRMSWETVGGLSGALGFHSVAFEAFPIFIFFRSTLFPCKFSTSRF